MTRDVDRGYLLDKSALWRLATHPDVEQWFSLIQRGLMSVSTLTLLEVGFSARNGADHRQLLGSPIVSSMPVENILPAMEDRALEVQRMLADRGQHRAPSVPDLLIAATAELLGLQVLHLDKNFDLIEEVTGQPMRRLDQAGAD